MRIGTTPKISSQPQISPITAVLVRMIFIRQDYLPAMNPTDLDPFADPIIEIRIVLVEKFARPHHRSGIEADGGIQGWSPGSCVP